MAVMNPLSHVTTKYGSHKCDFTFGSPEVNNENLYLARCSAVDFHRLQALRIQTLDIHRDRGGLQAPVQRATNKRAGRADILTRQISRKAVS